ncbi:MAG: type II toxin-antitoxin system RelE/ParE family toxin [Planctomycetes bacterium]|nr:type II toxin-antitoxin system RelE/ParE family toxin [Planctomycetota bacterium]
MGKRQGGGPKPAPLTWRVELETRARREYLDLESSVAGRVAAVLDDLQKNPRPPGAKRLVGIAGFRVRVGDWRILYTIDDPNRLVRIYRIRNRKDVYRDL